MEAKRKQLVNFVAMMQNMTVSVSAMQTYVVQHLMRNKRLRKLVISGNILTNGYRGIKKIKTKRIVKHWVRPGRTSAWWDNLRDGKMLEEEWYENFRMKKESFMILCEKLRQLERAHLHYKFILILSSALFTIC